MGRISVRESWNEGNMYWDDIETDVVQMWGQSLKWIYMTLLLLDGVCF